MVMVGIFRRVGIGLFQNAYTFVYSIFVEC